MSKMNRKAIVHADGAFKISKHYSFGEALNHVMNYKDGTLKEIYYTDGEQDYLEWSNVPETSESEEEHVDPVNSPTHYQNGGIETIELIKEYLTPEEFRGYLKGNIIKYRERAPYKGNAEQDYAKGKWYFDRLKGD